MKTFFLTLAAFSLALIIMGCQENVSTEPETSTLFKDGITTTNTNLFNRIKICCEVRDPEYGACNLNGNVNYVHQVINQTMNPLGLNEILLKLQMDSRLCDMLGMMHLEWRIEGRSEDVVYVSEEGIAVIEKCYSITNRTDVVLLVKYLVTTDGVGISSLNLAPLEK
ncbi:MAG: hypothetical protein HXY48_06385 [Ignavibacteriaceae bacterium]|nr:hypothetical protein [Ignavibacteriaceae bacterium]